jgi:hypothetical protein
VPIIAKGGDTKTYALATEGVHQAVCVDVIDLGMLKSSFPDERTGELKMQHKVNVVWQIEDLRDDGKRFLLYKRYTLSLHEKATLRHDLQSWRGKAFTAEELYGFDIEKLIGANALVNVQHSPSKDGTKTFANVLAVMPLVKGMIKMSPRDYVRQEPEAKPVPALAEPAPQDNFVEPNWGPDDDPNEPPF